MSGRDLKEFERGLSPDNAVRLLVEVEELGLDAVRDACLSYMISNYGKVMTTASIDSLSHSLKGALLHELIKKQKDTDR